MDLVCCRGLNEHYGENGSTVTESLAYDIYDEPLASPYNRDSQAPNNSNLPDTDLNWRPRRLNAIANWRKIQGNAAAGILALNSSATILLSSYDNFPESYVDPETQVADPAKFPYYFAAYSALELPSKNLLYKVHLYNPFRYTHWRSQAEKGYESTPNYVYKRDFLGEQLEGEPISPPWSAGQFPPLKGNLQEGFEFIMKWRLENGNAKMMVTGFGAEQGGGDPPDPIGIGVLGTCDEPPNAIFSETVKSQFLYDVRTTLENYGIGWTVFDLYDSMPTWEGRYDGYYANWRYKRSCQPRRIVPQYSQALFGSTRS